MRASARAAASAAFAARPTAACAAARTPPTLAAAAVARPRTARRVPAAPAGAAGRTGWRRSRRRRARGTGPERHLDRPRDAAALDDDRDLVAGALRRDDRRQLRRIGDALTRNGLDHVADLERRAGGRAPGDDAGDLGAPPAAAGIGRGGLDAEVGAPYGPALLEDRDDLARGVRRN